MTKSELDPSPGLTLGIRDFDIMKYLVSHPTCTMEEVAQSLQCRPETVTSHIRSMKERELYYGTMGLLSYQKLDMAYIPVLVRAPVGSIDKLYRIVRAHPYIQYSVRTLGSSDGAFLIFTQPQNAIPQLIEFLDELAARGVITDYRFFIDADTKRSFLLGDLRYFNPQTGNWDFNWDRWGAEGETNTLEPALNGGRIETLTIEPELHTLDKSDIELLAIISDDAKTPTEDMAKAVNVPPHTVRRRIQKLEEDGFIIGYRAMVAFSQFHLSSTMLFDCNARPSEIDVCRKKLLTLPFPGTFIPVQNGFLCQLSLPAPGLAPVQGYLAHHSNNVAVSWYDLPTSDVAKFNSKAFANGAWNIEADYLIQQPLRQMNKESA
jgi:DNA-binding Lrp family transcriptional regulator